MLGQVEGKIVISSAHVTERGRYCKPVRVLDKRKRHTKRRQLPCGAKRSNAPFLKDEALLHDEVPRVGDLRVKADALPRAELFAMRRVFQVRFILR